MLAYIINNKLGKLAINYCSLNSRNQTKKLPKRVKKEEEKLQPKSNGKILHVGIQLLFISAKLLVNLKIYMKFANFFCKST